MLDAENLSRIFPEEGKIPFYGPYYEQDGYSGIPKGGFSEEDWKELEAYTNYLNNYYGKLGIEDKPEIKHRKVFLKSFFGEYRFNSGRNLRIKLNERKISEKSLSKMLEEILDLVPILGITLDSILKFISPSCKVRKTLVYSNLLKKITIMVLNERPPIQSTRKEYISPEVQGQINIPKTIKRRCRGENHVVSSKANITMETLPALIFVKLHGVILRELENYLKEIEPDDRNDSTPRFSLQREIKKRKAHHQSILSHPIYAKFYKKAMRKDLRKSETLEKARKESFTSPTFQDVVGLWESYLSGDLPKPKVESIITGGYSLKPASKIYELWVLKKLVKVLEELCGKAEMISIENDGSADIRIGKSCELKYNKTPPNRNIEGGFQRRRPDFTLWVDDPEKTPIIIDAKYKPRHNAVDDIPKMIAYLFAYEWDDPSDRGDVLLAYIGKNDEEEFDPEEVRRTIPPYARVSSLKLRPNKEGREDIGLDKLRKYCRKILEEKASQVLV